jgi:hypothetical protein
MNYLKVYCNLIRKAENRTPPEGYTEKHHTFPKSIFGNNNKIVVLTAREHYIAHLLLEKICIKRYGIGDNKTRKMTLACVMMRNRSEKYNSHLYEEVRKRYSQNMKERMKGENNPSYGVPCTEDRKQKIREKHLGRKASQETKDKMSMTRKGRRFRSYIRNGKKSGNYLKIYDLQFREMFIEIVKTSHTKTEILRRLDNRVSYKCVVGWIKELELDTTHFTGNLGLKHTDKARENIRLAKLGEKNPFYGKSHTDEVKNKMSEDRIGEKNAFYGRTHNEETKQKIREKNREKMKGQLWWNNGQIEKRGVECPGDEWVRGRIKTHSKLAQDLTTIHKDLL